MNDFTKEELEELRASRCYHLDDSFPADDKLFMKIESMIDNYCEHELDNKNLLINPINVPGTNNWDVVFKWEGLKGHRRMLIELEQDGFSLPYEGVKDIKRLCEEFLNNEDRHHQYLRVEKS